MVKDIDPELLVGLGFCVGIVHLACPVLMGYFMSGRGPCREWLKPEWGVRGTSTAGLGLSLMALIVFLRVRPAGITVGDRWIFLAGFVAAVMGQIIVVVSLPEGALSPPVPGERIFPRICCIAAPVVVFILVVSLRFAPGIP